MPRLLDLFCCEGGAAMGYHRAGWEVFGVDTDGARLRHYPFPAHKGDALEFLRDHGHLFDAVHASPPCQRYTRGNAARDTTGYPDLIGATRTLLLASGLPYIIENVADARPQLRDPMLLCGTMFGLRAVDNDGHPLRLERHRLFESNRALVAPGPCHHDPSVTVAGSYGGARRQGDTPEARRHNARHGRKGGYVPDKNVRQALLGIDWMTERGLNECIPPAYTLWLGAQLAAADTRRFTEQPALF
jgi:DNA (cytosine-5)-methyltransferase 1